jgi:hypothetical protein
MTRRSEKNRSSGSLSRRTFFEGIWILIVVVLLFATGFAAHNQVDFGMKWAAHTSHTPAFMVQANIDR